MNIVLLGIQGSGKGTLVADLSNYLDFTLISVGQLLRNEVATGSELGKHIHKLQTAGNLVDTKIVVDVIKNNLKNSKGITIFDGFPRNSEQADELDTITKVDLVLYLKLSKSEAKKRILGRLTCKNCGYISNSSFELKKVCPICGDDLITRSDDTLESIEKRFKIYEQETYPLLERYAEAGIVEEIEVVSREVVLEKALRVINEYNNKK